MEYNIGFAGKYYTLWEHETVYRNNDMGVIFRRDNYRFIKNISFDRDKAIAKYPEATFNDDLRGRKGSWVCEVRVREYNKFHCGKYMGRLFDACTDYDYMKWFYNNCANDDQRNYLENLMKPEGYEVRVQKFHWDDELGETHESIQKDMLSPKEVQSIKEQKEREEKAKERFSTGTPFIVSMTRNLDEFGECFIKDLETKLKFEDFKCNCYEGYYYGLPKDKKGHAKRVKNKQLLIEKYEVLQDNTLRVKEWRFA